MDRRMEERPSESTTRRVRWTGLTLALVAAIAVMGIAASSAPAYIYVGGPITSWKPKPSTIERLTNDGSAVQPSFIDGPRVESANDLAVDGDRMYWLDAAAGDCQVRSASLDGTDVRTLATLVSNDGPHIPGSRPGGPGCGSFYSIALGDGYLYWNNETLDGEGATIGRMRLSPPYTMQRDFIHVPAFLYHPLAGEPFMTDTEVFGPVTDGSHIYWGDETRKTVGRARLDGIDIEPTLFQPEPPRGDFRLLGVARGYMWWQDERGAGSIGRARLDGSDVEPDFLTGIQLYDGAVTRAGWLYYTGSPACDGCVNIDGTVRRVALEPGATPHVVARGLGEGAGSSIAVDSLGGRFPKVRIARHRNGTATAIVSTPRPANVSVHGKRIVPATARHRDHKVARARVAIRPRRAAVRALRRHGAAHVRVRIKYRPFGGLTRRHSRALTLRLGRH